MKTAVASCLLLGVTVVLAAPPVTPQEKTKAALQELQDFIGGWKGNGTSSRDRTLIWNEAVDWSWRFKGDDSWLSLDFPMARNFKKGEVRYQPREELYQLTLVDRNDKSLVFSGTLVDGQLTVERQDPDTKDMQRIKMYITGGGVRLVYAVDVKPAKRTVFNPEYQVGFTRKGEEFAAGKKQIECVVTGGLGTIAVSYNGATYYVCCSGCRDAFNDNPEKILKQYAERKKKEKNP